MGDTAEDPVDHARTTRPHAGESMKDTANMPALVFDRGGSRVVRRVPDGVRHPSP